jgi:hypothetical protein
MDEVTPEELLAMSIIKDELERQKQEAQIEAQSASA